MSRDDIVRENQTIYDVYDRHHLQVILKRFLDFNRQRLERTCSSMPERQVKFIDALALLFHCNHPMLPGYVGREAPCGISGFAPSKTDLARGRSIAKSFCVQRYDSSSAAIWGIFLMGSMGTIAQTHRSDLDIWICCAPHLEREQKKLLQEKCEKISRWATTLQLEVHFFLMDCDMFREGSISDLDEESSGSAQRYLLLDEFYRTGIYIAGRYPMWWFIPAGQEREYEKIASDLLSRRYIESKVILDFGPLPEIPRNEFIGAAIWQLYKAIESPYKSILKLFLLETYVANFLGGHPLCLVLKQKIYKGKIKMNEVDAYVMVYRRIESYFKSEQQEERLALLQRAFYFKINRALSRTEVSSDSTWQLRYLDEIVKHWGWKPQQIAELDQRASWRVNKVVDEREQLIAALNYTYQKLNEIISQSLTPHAISTQEINVLGRKLKAAYEIRDGKIELINPDLSKNLQEERIFINCASSTDYGQSEGEQDKSWMIHESSSDLAFHFGSHKSLIKSNKNLAMSLVWGFYNGVISSATAFDFSEKIPLKTQQECVQLIKILESWMRAKQNIAPHQNFLRAAVPTDVLLLINFDNFKEDPEDIFDGYYISETIDAFNYGEHEENLIISIDVVEKNSWNEITVKRYEGNSALFDGVQHYLSMAVPGSNQSLPSLSIRCVGFDHAKAIEKRVWSWFQSITKAYYSLSSSKNARFVFKVAGEYGSMAYKKGRFDFCFYKNIRQLTGYLCEPQSNFSPMVVDSNSIESQLLIEIAKRNEADAIEMYVEKLDNVISVYICDERGTLYVEHIKGSGKRQNLRYLQLYIYNVSRRIAENHSNFLGMRSKIPFNRYIIEKNGRHDYKIEAQHSDGATPVIDEGIKVQLYLDDNNFIRYDFYTLGVSLFWKDWGEQIFEELISTIEEKRKQGQRASFLIEDIDVGGCVEFLTSFGSMQLTQYLNLKHSLEMRLKHLHR